MTDEDTEVESFKLLARELLASSTTWANGSRILCHQLLPLG